MDILTLHPLTEQVSQWNVHNFLVLAEMKNIDMSAVDSFFRRKK